ncbi:aldolase/citrate lyase family protein [Serratia proteamaculans]|uniref:2,4-dihydroxyhept-2-ene-1,7-dioic acid aldolase n=1 Tax=Serratia proteamaculans TaxID=28151 RepID=A0A7U0N875_SERPR|nr:aldolase/citrate lyase family protein [Serratia proteamaculans]MBO1501011.1 2,4-dihydroxyhept-2-ene-1,7-dioic acid aldolase [Serratia proteamaculans]MDW5509930.1 aldolase/citrate lyase family protein [Serratia proteamaculans]QQX54039.1 2,4-dihydroxyhept-2-ene-1,7-dioic acid aldolase [Serratia proteamaculans]WEO91042.1 aldolase/citrate lyase family protein [Serratia proteamaculans]
MRKNPLKAAFRQQQPIINGWLAIPSGYSAEIAGHQGYDSVTVDLQHGMIDFASALSMLQALSSTPATPLARVNSNEPAQIMRLLDAGAWGIICPMISTAEQAQQFVSACRYPPMGTRSFGPARALLYGGKDYPEYANEEILTLAMIETREGLDNLDAILDTDGLDGVFIGPNDLSLTLTGHASAESQHPDMLAAVELVLARSHAHKKLAGIFCTSGQAAASRLAQGFQFVTPANDVMQLGRAAREAVALARGETPTASGTSGY